MLALALALLAAPQGSPARGIGVADDVHDALSTGYARRHALVIGIDDYEDPSFSDLGYAVADAKAVARVLVERYGFAQEDVRLLVDPGRDELAEGLEDWACDPSRVGEDDLLVVFYAGHGINRRIGVDEVVGYFVPADARTRADGRLAWSGLIGMNDLHGVSKAVAAKHVLFLLDCCFGGIVGRRAPAGLAPGLESPARQIITAGNERQEVGDLGLDGHSPFTRALLSALGGAADDDLDGVVTFGELYEYVATEVIDRTDSLQTPGQGILPGHGLGNVALFHPDTSPGARLDAAEQLARLRRAVEENYEELKGFSDERLVRELEAQKAALWPQVPALVSSYREWLRSARSLLARRPLHEKALRRVRVEAHLSQVVKGMATAAAPVRPNWEHAEPEQLWRHETLTELLAGLDRIQAAVREIEHRLLVASTVAERTVTGPEAAWAWGEAIDSIHGTDECPAYRGLSLRPTMGLLPLGRDVQSRLWEFAHVQTGSVPHRDELTGELVIDEGTCVVLVLLPGGEAFIGAQKEDPVGRHYDPLAQEHESPVHAVSLAPFYVSKYELSQEQWVRLTGDSPSYTRSPLHPVESVSWDQCTSALARVGMQLPTEAQWEYAARAGTSTPWWTGAERDSLEGAANLADRSAKRFGHRWMSIGDWPELDDGEPLHGSVLGFRPNRFGLHNVCGNVWEWCRDSYAPYSASADESARAGPSGVTFRVLRGGGYAAPAALARSANRSFARSVERDNMVGVRPVVPIDGAPRAPRTD